MPREQRGSVTKYRGSWCARYYDEHGKQRRKRGFPTATAADRWLRRRVDEVERLRRGEIVLGGRQTPPTVRELCQEYLDQYAGEDNSKAALESRLKHVLGSTPGRDGKRRVRAGAFADLRAERLTVATVGTWRRQLPAGSAWQIVKALRQVLNYGVAAGYLDRNVAREVANPQPKRKPIPTFATVEEIDAVASSTSNRTAAAVVVFASETGLRTEEWLALERGDVDLAAGLVYVRRVYVAGKVRDHGKTSRSLREVPLTARAAAAVRSLPPRIDTPILFPSHRGGEPDCGRCKGRRCYHLDLQWWRQKVWAPALRAAGLDVDDHGRKVRRGPYSLRHTYATWMLAAGVPAGDVAEFMGTSIEQLDQTYRHRSDGAHERAVQAIERWQAGDDEAEAEA